MNYSPNKMTKTLTDMDLLIIAWLYEYRILSSTSVGLLYSLPPLFWSMGYYFWMDMEDDAKGCHGPAMFQNLIQLYFARCGGTKEEFALVINSLSS